MKNKLRLIINKGKWNLERIKYQVEKKNLENTLPKGKKIILAPHSDDEWIGCSQIIKNEKNTIIINMNMLGNDSDKIHKLRYKEMLYTASKYKLKLITLDENKKMELKKIITEYKPKYICIPYYIDWHEEHIEVMNNLKDAITNMNNIKIIMYQVSLPMYNEDITNYSILSKKEWRNKWNYFVSTYKTQESFPYYRFATNERINGKIFNTFAVEVYSIISVDEWINMITKKVLTKEQKNIVKKELHSITKTREYLHSIKK